MFVAHLLEKRLSVPVLALKIIYNYVMLNYMTFQYCMQVNYISGSYNIDEEYEELYGLLNFIYRQKKEDLLDVNIAMTLFIKENIDMVEDYLIVEEQ